MHALVPPAAAQNQSRPLRWTAHDPPSGKKSRAEIGEPKFAEIFQKAPFAIAIVGAEHHFIKANEAFCRLLGYSERELASRRFWEVAHPEEIERDKRMLERMLRGRTQTAELVKRFIAKDGKVQWMNVLLSPIESTSGKWRGISMIENVPKRKRAEQLLGLSKRIVKAQELEQRWIARELHDSVNQILSSVKFRVESAKGKIARQNRGAFQELAKSRDLLELAIQEVRRISQKLRPTVLDDLGLAAAVRSLCADYRERLGLDIEARILRLEAPLPSDIEVTLYRILQEALRNVEKHARARRVTVQLFEQGSEAWMRIKDNGRGFAQASGRTGTPAGLGLIHMRERAMFVGGSMSVESALNMGTEVVVRIPFKRRATD